MKSRSPIKSAADAKFAKQYLVRKCRGGDDSYLTRGGLTEQGFIKALNRFDFSDSASVDIDLRNLHTLCLNNLDDKQWAALKNALRVKRAKTKNGLVRADLTPEAHSRINDYIEWIARDSGMRMTISEVILKEIPIKATKR